MNYTYDTLFMLCVDKEIKTSKSLASHLNIGHEKLYTFLLDNYPNLMKEVNHTLFIDDVWWDNEYTLTTKETLLKVGEGNLYLTQRGIPLRKMTTHNRGNTYTKLVEVKLSYVGVAKGTKAVRVTINGKVTTVTVARLVAKLFMKGYDPSKRVESRQSTDLNDLYQNP